jgi:tetratricopeptide (TPR) repeat protein
VALGCGAGAATSARAPDAGRPDKPDDSIVLASVVVSPFDDAELARQFHEASALLLAGKAKEAQTLFEKLERLGPERPTAAPSLTNAGVALEAQGLREEALVRYRAVRERFSGHEAEKLASLRGSRALAYLEQWIELDAWAQKLTQRADLSVLETIEARGLLALARVEQGKADDAARELDKAMQLIEEHKLGQAGVPPIELAAAWFALGEVRKAKSERVVFDPVPANFGDALEQRCQGLLDAQSAYTEAMRARDAHWSAMAGFRVGQLYQDLHRDVMRVPPPKAASTLRKKQLFEGAMRLRYRTLLEKGLKMMAGTVDMAARTGESSAWVKRAEEAKRELELSLADEKQALSKLPFTEDELRAALDSLKKP